MNKPALILSLTSPVAIALFIGGVIWPKAVLPLPLAVVVIVATAMWILVITSWALDRFLVPLLVRFLGRDEEEAVIQQKGLEKE